MTVWSVVCTQLPLFNYLGFEFSALTAVAAFLVTGYWTLAAAHSGQRPLRDILLTSQVLLLLPLSIISFNGMFVKNCSWTNGVLYFLLLVPPSVFLANGLAWMLAALPFRRKNLWFTMAAGGILLHIVIVTMLRPQIFAFNPVIGFFPGFTYDETLEVLPRLAAYRLTTLVLAGILFGLARWHTGSRLRSVVIAAGMVLAAVYVFSDRLGFSSSSDSISRELGGVIHTDHFDIVYPAAALSGEQARRIGELHEFTFARLKAALDAKALYRVQSFLYLSAAQKGTLTGAGGTVIAKPWLHQVHINLSDLEATLKHELVHVVAYEHGLPPLGVALNPGLIEGTAVAMEEMNYEQPLHRTAAQIFAVGLQPDVESLFGYFSFAAAPSTVSYTLAGSFCRYLIDTYGMGRFRLLYRFGDFKTIYTTELKELIVDWREFIDTVEVTEAEKTKAGFLFKRRSIFGKECARVIANLNAAARSETDPLKSLELIERSLALSPSADAVQLKAALLVRLGRFGESEAYAGRMLHDSAMALSLVPMCLTLVDARWGMGDTEGAVAAARSMGRIHLSTSYDEAAAIRIAAIRSGSQEALWKKYFLEDRTDSLRRTSLRTIADSSHPASTSGQLTLYLLGRESARVERYQEVIQFLSGDFGMPDTTLRYLRLRRLGRAWLMTHQPERARLVFWEALNFARTEAREAEIREWLDRCLWAEQMEQPASGK